MERFECPSDCARCCADLTRSVTVEEQESVEFFRDALRELGVHACSDGATSGLSVSPDEADALRARAAERGQDIDLHPRTFLLDATRKMVVVLDWHLAATRCPFLDGYRCGAYEVRPLVCRAFPVLSPSPRWALAPSCPEMAGAEEARANTGLRLGTYFRSESSARRAADDAYATLDATAMRLLEVPTRWVKDIDADEAMARAMRWRKVSSTEYEAHIGG